MALRVWLHRTAPNDVAAHWALALHERCRQYNALPGPGGAYDQDEYLMAMMDRAAGVSALFDADGKALTNEHRLALHTQLQADAAEFIRLENERNPTDDDTDA